LLAVSVFGGLPVPLLAGAMHGFNAPNVMVLMTRVLLRVDEPRVAEGLHPAGDAGQNPAWPRVHRCVLKP